MIKLKSEMKKYEDRIRENIPKLDKALKEENLSTIYYLLGDIFDCTCVNNMLVSKFNCGRLTCSECRKTFVRELIIKYGKKNNIKW